MEQDLPGRRHDGDDRTSPSDAEALERLATLSRLLDGAFRIPGTGIRFGFDAILGLIPGVGDVLTNVVSAYLVLEARRLGASRTDMVRMVGNILVDAVLSSIPIAGDIFDVFWRANDRNMAILRAHLAQSGRVVDGEFRRIDG